MNFGIYDYHVVLMSLQTWNFIIVNILIIEPFAQIFIIMVRNMVSSKYEIIWISRESF